MATSIPKTKTKWANATLSEIADSNEVQLTYSGKKPETAILNSAPASIQTLWSGGTNNRLYYGNNLPILAHLLKDVNVSGKVRLIYIDPPYATNGVFQSRAQQDAYQDLLTGARYIEFLRQRLVLLRELLAEDGSIYVHLDENMAFHVKLIMDEVFGPKNYRNFIVRRKSSHKNYTRKTYGNIADYILFYTKSDNYVWNRPLESWTKERGDKEYSCIEPETGRRYKKVPVHAPGVRNGATGGLWKGKLPPPGKHWQYSPEQLDQMDARGEIYWSANGNPRRKIYLENSQGIPMQDIWYEFRDSQNQNTKITGYPTEKNAAMLNVLIEASSSPGDLVLDCFAGSGTFLSEASKLARNWIGIDESQEALETMLRRFAHGVAPMGDYVSQPSQKEYEQLHLLQLQEEEEVSTNIEPVHQPFTDFSLFGIQPPDLEIAKFL